MDFSAQIRDGFGIVIHMRPIGEQSDTSFGIEIDPDGAARKSEVADHIVAGFSG